MADLKLKPSLFTPALMLNALFFTKKSKFGPKSQNAQYLQTIIIQICI